MAGPDSAWRVGTDEHRPIGALLRPVLADRLGDRQDVVPVERGVQARTAVARRAEDHPLVRYGDVGVQVLVRREHGVDVDEIAGLSWLSCAWIHGRIEPDSAGRRHSGPPTGVSREPRGRPSGPATSRRWPGRPRGPAWSAGRASRPAARCRARARCPSAAIFCRFSRIESMFSPRLAGVEPQHDGLLDVVVVAALPHAVLAQHVELVLQLRRAGTGCRPARTSRPAAASSSRRRRRSGSAGAACAAPAAS